MEAANANHGDFNSTCLSKKMNKLYPFDQKSHVYSQEEIIGTVRQFEASMLAVVVMTGEMSTIIIADHRGRSPLFAHLLDRNAELILRK